MAASRSINRIRVFPVVLAGLMLFVLAGPALATWSIVVVNTETGEVGVGSATCIDNWNLKKAVGVIVVGKGAAQAQAWVDSTGVNRTTMANGLLAGLTAEEVLDELKATDPDLESHQYGIADLSGCAATFTGTKTNAYTAGLTGQVGPIHYAIQGNVLAGEMVLLAAEDALVNSVGDLGQRVMAAMHAAKFYGGDGRCSCSEFKPDSCGSPVIRKAIKNRDRWWVSAEISYLTIARIGDTDGEFTKPTGFASGDYYLDLNISKTINKVDTVDILQEAYEEFRASWAGHADHILTQKIVAEKSTPGDNGPTHELLIQLVDIDNRLISWGGAAITVTHDDQSAKLSEIGPVIDHGDGSYSCDLTPAPGSGTDIFRVVVEDGMGRVTLYSFPTLELE
ncbi:MAG: DUF1028 domain-containing protein [Planctomycetota bacterium]